MIKLRRPTAAHSRSVDLGAESDEGIVNFLNSVSGLCRCAEDDDDMMVNMIIMMMMNGTNGQRNCQLSDLRWWWREEGGWYNSNKEVQKILFMIFILFPGGPRPILRFWMESIWGFVICMKFPANYRNMILSFSSHFYDFVIVILIFMILSLSLSFLWFCHSHFHFSDFVILILIFMILSSQSHFIELWFQNISISKHFPSFSSNIKTW